MTDSTQHEGPVLASTGVAGLDEILGGGLPTGRLYFVEGGHGSGKTTLALQFCMAGARRGERVLYATNTETEDEVREIADSHGWSLDGVELAYLDPRDFLVERLEQSVFHAPEVELPRAMGAFAELIERVDPQRFVLDSITELRLLADDVRAFRLQLLALRSLLSGRACTSLFCADRPDGDRPGRSIVHGVIRLEHASPGYGPGWRRIEIPKLRGRAYASGFHDVAIRRGGLEVFPRLSTLARAEVGSASPLPSGIAELDRMLGGGLDRSTMTLFVGAPGTGKSALAAQYAAAAAARGEPTLMLLFDERPHTVFSRADGLGLPLRNAVERDLLRMRKVEPAEFTPGRLSHAVRKAVERHGVRLVILDSLAGYAYAMPDQRALILHMHELLSYLAAHGVTSLGVATAGGWPGGVVPGAFDPNYLCDTVLGFHCCERDGVVSSVLAVDKRRGGLCERGLRCLEMGPSGIAIGAPVSRADLLAPPGAGQPDVR